MSFSSPPPKRREKAAALIIVLAFVVLLSGVVVAYFSRAITNRQLSNSSFYQAKSDEMARSALDIIVSNLKQEIVNGSTASTIAQATVYLPSTTATMFPVRNGTPQSSGTSVFPTLLRVSSTSAISAPGVDYPASSAVSTGTSANGRYVTPSRWNKHYLVPRDSSLYSGASNSKKLGTDPDPRFPIPNWVYLTGTGPASPALTSPTHSVIGRYAYAIYDEGALLDANVAGGPYAPANVSGTLAMEYTAKGSIAFADLAALGISATSGINNLVGWRQYASLHPTGNLNSNFQFSSTVPAQYRDLVLSNTNGFVTISATSPVGPTDQMFLSRQALIAFSRLTSGSIIPQDALQYLGTFSRALNAPSWLPSTPAGSSVDYAGIADQATSNNRNLPKVCFSAATSVTHYRDDGTKQDYNVQSGDPVLRQRFSLAKLSWLTPNGPTTKFADADKAIKSCFGLEWDTANHCWKYTELSGNSNPIKTLATVAGENREPNFFEVLKAGILAGSVGKQPGAIGYAGDLRNASADGGPCGKDFDLYFGTTPDQHIVQIGANIIDQFDTDSFPTAINFPVFVPDSMPEHQPVNMVYGVENLPYLTELDDIVIQTSNTVYQGWLQPNVWNPHQAPATISSNRPTQFRIVAAGQVYVQYRTNDGADNFPSPHIDYNTSPDDANIYFTDRGGAGSAFYAHPNCTAIDLTATDPHDGSVYNIADLTQTKPVNYWNDSYAALITATANKFVAFHAGTVDPFTPKSHNTGGSDKHYIYPAPMVTFCLQYWDGSAYRPYNYISRIASWTYFDIPTEGSTSYKICYSRPDPRTDRFSLAMNSSGYGSTKTKNATYQKDKSTSDNAWAGKPRKTQGFSYVGSKLAEWAVNSPSSNVYYADNDNIIRPGDAYRQNLTTGQGCIQFHATSGTAASVTARRPVILDRPFRSVGELGYVFRDLPFKSLDLWSPNSSDAALLDLFSVNESEPPVSAGQVNLNNAAAPVLQAIIAGTLKNEASGLVTGTATAQRLASSLAARLAQAPIANRADLPAALDGAITAAMTTDPDLANKAYAEAAERALSPATQTRTWNLLIDIIAQTGVFSSGAPSTEAALNNAFFVQGERRYWLHIAIDRFTGKVVDQQLEPVYE